MMITADGSQTEFYSPFAHLPHRYEWCRIHCPSHGSFDIFIVIESGTHKPVTTFVSSDNGAAFMKERYPESRTFRVAPKDLRLKSTEEGSRITGRLRSSDGPITEAEMQFVGDPEGRITESRYGGEHHRVWGGRWTCKGVDLEISARVTGHVIEAGKKIILDGESAILTLGSYGQIMPMQ